MLRVYLASWFDSKDERKQQAIELQNLGIEVTSRWLDEPPQTKLTDEFLNHTANLDLEDIERANVLVIFTPDEAHPKVIPQGEKTPGKNHPDKHSCSSWARGGRNFEQGYFYATMRFYNYMPLELASRGKREIVICGKRETLFHWSGNEKFPPIIKQFDTWPQVVEYLKSRA